MSFVHDYSAEFDRQDLHTRMAPRRRLLHPTSATTTSSTLRSGGGQAGQAGHPVPTYSQFLNAFDYTAQSPSVFQPPGLSYPASSIYRPDEGPVPGPSRARGGSRSFGEVGIMIAGDALQELIYVGEEDSDGAHGKIEEVGDDDKAIDGDDHRGLGDNDSIETPRAQRAATVGRGATTNGVHAPGNENVPLISTPPPGTRARKLPGLRERLSHRSLNAPSTLTATPGMDIFAPGAGPPSQVAESDPYEVALVKEDLELTISSQEHVKFLSTYFFAQSAENVTQHTDICSKLEEHLASLRRTLTVRMQMSAEEWSVRSSTWDQNYTKRLISLRTTLQRLGRMRHLIETQPFRPRQRLAILTKLEQHEAKLADLASKYSTAFDRLRLRHLHFLLTQSHNEAKRQKAQKGRLMSRASFERRWREGKAFRAGLRNEFYELRQEFYNAQRPDRQTIAP